MGALQTVAILVVGAALTLSCKRRVASDERARLSPEARAAASLHGKLQSFRDGDLIFHESMSGQSEMVRALTGSRWTHMGVLFNEASGPVVLEAASPVRRTPVEKWVARGKNQEYVLKRLRDAETRLGPAALARMRTLGAAWLGRPYDLRFRWDDQALYCSELAFKLFERGAGVRLGKLQTAADMNLDDERVQRAVRKRFVDAKFNPGEVVVTPDSIFNDEQLVEVRP